MEQRKGMFRRLWTSRAEHPHAHAQFAVISQCTVRIVVGRRQQATGQATTSFELLPYLTAKTMPNFSRTGGMSASFL